MRCFLIAFFTIFALTVSGQSFLNYKDSASGFSIHIPSGWKYGKNPNYPAIKLIAFRTLLSNSDSCTDNFNINIVESGQKSLQSTFEAFLESLKGADNLKVLNSGDTILNGTQFKWIVETHKNQINEGRQMINYDFVTVKNGNTYILTMVSFSNCYESAKTLFDNIANSFILLR